MLSPLSPSPTGTYPESADAPVYIGLETVVIAEYLNRNEIVLNLDNTIYQLADFNQWAEPLDDNLTRVLEENLTRLLRNDSIEVFLASQSSIPLDYRLEIDVLLEVTGRMKEAKMAAIMAQMTPSRAEELTLRLATQPHLPEKEG